MSRPAVAGTADEGHAVGVGRTAQAIGWLRMPGFIWPQEARQHDIQEKNAGDISRY